MKVGDSIHNGTLLDLFNFYDPKILFSTPDYRTDMLGRSIGEVPITDFLGSMLDVDLHFDEEAYPIKATPAISVSRPEVTQTANSIGSCGILGPTEQDIKYRTAASEQSFGFTRAFLAALAAVVVSAVFVTMQSI